MKRVVTMLLLVLLVSLQVDLVTYAKQPELIKIRCTCYASTGNPTRSGCMPYEGIISSNYYYGKTLILYDLEMNYIGIYEIKDTGGAETLKTGKSIDVYRDTLERCYEWVGEYGDYIYIQVIEEAAG